MKRLSLNKRLLAPYGFEIRFQGGRDLVSVGNEEYEAFSCRMSMQ